DRYRLGEATKTAARILLRRMAFGPFGGRGYPRRNAANAISVLTRPGTAPAVQGERPPPSETACAITEAAQSTIVSAIPTATAPASGIRRRGRSMPSASPIDASAAGTTCT